MHSSVCQSSYVRKENIMNLLAERVDQRMALNFGIYIHALLYENIKKRKEKSTVILYNLWFCRDTTATQVYLGISMIYIGNQMNIMLL